MSPERDDDLHDLAEVAELLALGPSDVVDEQPPASLWAGIEAELQAEGASATDLASGAAHPSDAPVISGADLVSGGGALDEPEPDSYDGPVVSLDAARSKRNLRMAVVVGIAAAVLLIGVPVGLALRESSDDQPGDFIAADLDALSDELAASGEAELADRELRVETMGLDPLDDAVYELWLLDIVDGEPADLVSVGVIDAAGTFIIDESVDLDRFNVVDISIEPTDGDPSHSGNSVLRGEL